MLCLWYIVWCLHKLCLQLSRINALQEVRQLKVEPAVVRILFSMFKFSSKRKDSAIRTLVAETLVLAKTHGYVEKIEHELEEELQRENTEPPNEALAKWRRNGEKLLKNKYTLLTVALFCVTECALILGELILDLHKVKDVLEAQENAAKAFALKLNTKYPNQVSKNDTISVIYDRILDASIIWNTSAPYTETTESGRGTELRHRRAIVYQHLMSVVEEASSSVYNNKTPPMYYKGSNFNTHTHADGSHGHSLEEAIAHAFHKASITILSLLVVETILKALCAGTAFFSRKLETFDLCVVLISFVVDLVCMQIMPSFKIQDFVFILAFLLPWRVIRVVNSLVVAVQDHEHFRLKLIYGRKKKIVNSLKESEIKLQLFRAQCNALKRLCFNEGIDEAKIDQIMMVEECVVNKAGKSKCKIKIDNSSVILLNDKSDFPRLSPRPSLLNLVEKVGGRRKSMQQQLAPSTERELCAFGKDSPKKGILKFRARSNSESGRGALSSPIDGSTHLNGIFDGSGYSGLSTPIVINRKSSLSSPVMANHVRNILNSLEDRVNQMNGSCSRVSGRGSIDADSIAEEEEEVLPARRFGRRVHSIDETAASRERKFFSSASKRRASLQHQKCVDEDDSDTFLMKTFRTPSNYAATNYSGGRDFGHSPNNTNDVIEAVDFYPQLHSPRIIPTTIQVDPPSIHSSYSLSSSASSSSNHSNRNASVDLYRLGATTSLGIVSNGKISPQSPDLFFHSTLQGVLETKEPSRSVTPESQTQLSDMQDQTCATAAASLKPKTVRTPSDIENQNNMTLSESSDICESQSNDADTRNTSIEEIEDFESFDTVVTICNTDESVLSGASPHADIKQLHVKPDLNQQMTHTTKGLTLPSSSMERNGTAGKSPKSPTEGRMYASAKSTSADVADCNLKSDSVSHLLS